MTHLDMSHLDMNRVGPDEKMMHTETRPNPPQKRPIGTEVAGTQRYTAKLEGRCGTSTSVTERCGWTMQMGCGCAAVRSRPNRNTLEGRYAILRLRCLGGVLVLRRRAEFLRCGRRMRCARRGRLVRLLLAHTFKPKRLFAPPAIEISFGTISRDETAERQRKTPCQRRQRLPA